MNTENQETNHQDCYLIQRIPIEHCKRGRFHCEKCKEIFTYKYCLFNICPEGPAARRTIAVEIDGKKVYRTFDMIKSFDSKEEAESYAKSNTIRMIILPNDITEDKTMLQLIKKLPKGWFLYQQADSLFIQRAKPCYVLFENPINAPINTESKEEKVRRIEKYGKETNCQSIFALKEKWSKEKIKEIQSQNDLIYQKIKTLPEKYQIKQLYNSSLSRKGNDFYTSDKPEEMKKIEAHQQEKNEWLQKITKIPDYHSEKYTLLPLSQEVSADGFYIFSPEEVSREVYQIEQLMRELLKREE